MKITLLNLLLFVSLFASAQGTYTPYVYIPQAGDYQSTSPLSGNTVLTFNNGSWEVFNGSSWVSTSNKPGINCNCTVTLRHEFSFRTSGNNAGNITFTGDLRIESSTTYITKSSANNASFELRLDGSLILDGGTINLSDGNNGSGLILATKDIRLLSGNVKGNTNLNALNGSGFVLDGTSGQILEIGIPDVNITTEYSNRFFVNNTTTDIIEIYSAQDDQSTITAPTGNNNTGHQPWPINSTTRIAELIIDNPTTVNLSGNRVITTQLTLEQGRLNLNGNNLTFKGDVVTKNNGFIDASDGTLTLDNENLLVMPEDIFTNTANGTKYDIQNLDIINDGGVKMQEDLTVTERLLLGAPNPNATDGLLDLVIEYGDYASAKYSTDTDGNLLDLNNYNDASPVLDNNSPYNKLNSYILTMGEDAKTEGEGDVTGVIRRQIGNWDKDYTFGHKNMTVGFSNPGGGVLPDWMYITSTRGDKGLHPDKERANYVNSNPTDSLLGLKSVDRLYQVSRVGGSNATRFNLRMPYSGNLNGNDEGNLVTWDHHLPYDGQTPHEHGKTNQDNANKYIELFDHGLAYLATYEDEEFTKYWMVGESVTPDTMWIGATGGAAASNWDVGLNWTSGVVPTFETNVLIPSPSVYQAELIIKDGEAWEARTFTMRDSAVVHMEKDATVPPTLTIFGGPTPTFGTGSWLNLGTFHPGNSRVIFKGDTTTIAGQTVFNQLEIETGVLATILSSSENTILDTLINNGTLNAWNNANVFRFAGESPGIVNPNGGVTQGFYDLHIGWNPIRTYSDPMDNDAITNLDLNSRVNATLLQDLEVRNNFVIEPGGIFKTNSGTINVGNNFNVKDTAEFDVNNFSMNIGNDFILDEKSKLFSDDSNFDLKGNFINNSENDIDFENGSVLSLTGTGEQEISGQSPTVFENLAVEKTSGNLVFTAQSNVKEELIMNLTGGDIYTDFDGLLTIGIEPDNPGTLNYTAGKVYGPLRRWFANSTNTGNASGLFPLGDNGFERFVTVEYSTAPSSGGTLTAQWSSDYPGMLGFPIAIPQPAGSSCIPFSANDPSEEGYWIVDDANGLDGGAYDITLVGEGIITINDICELAAVKRVGTGPWGLSGTHVEPAGTTARPIVKAENVTGWSNWVIAGGPANPLPVELIYFNADCTGEEVQLTWETASELNSMAFYLEKSVDGELWELVTEVEAAGTTNSNTTYAYTDRSPSAGVSYYRLVQEDFDGTSEIFGPVSVNCEFEEKDIKLFPNPSNNFFTLELCSSTSASNGKVEIYTNYGQLVEVRNIDIKKGKNQFYFTNVMSAGTYIVKVKSDKENYKPMRLVVVK